VIGALWLAGAAIAADPSAAPSATTTAAIADPVQLLDAFVILFLFGTVVVLLVLLFLFGSQWAYFSAAGRLARSGRSSTPASVSATIKQGEAAALGPGGAVGDLTINGPATIRVGVPATFTATVGEDAADATWTADPAAAAAIAPPTGSSISVVAIKAGQIKLTAAVGARQVTLMTTAEAASSGSQTVTLPFIGAGWGSIIVSIVIAVVVAALGLAGVLDGQAIAGLYGALVGYLFGMRTGASAGSDAGAGGSGGGGAGGDQAKGEGGTGGNGGDAG
jgi:hypothetical protein